MPGRRRPVLAVAGPLPKLASPSHRGQLRRDGFLSLPDLQPTQREGELYPLQQGHAEGTTAAATRSDPVATPSTKPAQSHDVSPQRPQSPPLQVVKRRIPISAPFPMQLSHVREEVLGAEGVPLATSVKPRAPPRKSKRNSRDAVRVKEGHERPQGTPKAANPVSLGTTIPLELQAVAAEVTSVTDKNDSLPSPNHSLNPAPSVVTRAESTATEVVSAASSSHRRDKITQTPQQTCVLSIEGGSVVWSKGAVLPRIQSKRWEKLTPRGKGHSTNDDVEAHRTPSSNAAKYSSTTAKTERPPQTALEGCVKSVPLYILLGATFMFCFWVMHTIKDDSGAALPAFVAGLGNPGDGAAEGGSMTVSPESDVEAAIRELRGRDSDDDRDGGWKRKRIVIDGFPGREWGVENFTDFVDDYFNATVEEHDAAT